MPKPRKETLKHLPHLCHAHARTRDLTPKEFALVPHHSEQEEGEEIECDGCTVAIMRRLGAL